MIFRPLAREPRALKKEAQALADARKARVAGPQGGVTTFFDNFLRQLLDDLFGAENLHGWDVSRAAEPGSVAEVRITQLRWLSQFVEGRRGERFATFAERRALEQHRRDTDIGDLELLMSQGVGHCMSWKGSPLFKSIYDFALLPMLLWDLKPATIFEIGSGSGVSARWMADTLAGYGITATIYSVDRRAAAESTPSIKFLAGDSAHPESLFDAKLLQSAPHPWLVVEDAHVNIDGVLGLFDPWFAIGDYVFVEDSRVNAEALERFLESRAGRYRIDTHYTDFFGRNATSARNSILRRM